MTYGLGNKCAKNLCNLSSKTLLLFFGTQCYNTVSNTVFILGGNIAAS